MYVTYIQKHIQYRAVLGAPSTQTLNAHSTVGTTVSGTKKAVYRRAESFIQRHTVIGSRAGA